VTNAFPMGAAAVLPLTPLPKEGIAATTLDNTMTYIKYILHHDT